MKINQEKLDYCCFVLTQIHSHIIWEWKSKQYQVFDQSGIIHIEFSLWSFFSRNTKRSRHRFLNLRDDWDPAQTFSLGLVPQRLFDFIVAVAGFSVSLSQAFKIQTCHSKGLSLTLSPPPSYRNKKKTCGCWQVMGGWWEGCWLTGGLFPWHQSTYSLPSHEWPMWESACITLCCHGDSNIWAFCDWIRSR